MRSIAETARGAAHSILGRHGGYPPAPRALCGRLLYSMRSQVVMNPWLPMAMQDGEIWERLQEGAVAVYRAAEDSGQQPEASRVGSLHMASEISVETPQKIECLGIAPTVRTTRHTTCNQTIPSRSCAWHFGFTWRHYDYVYPDPVIVQHSH